MLGHAAGAIPVPGLPFHAQVEALLQLGRSGEAGAALAAAVERSPAFAEDPDYAMLVEAVQGAPPQHAGG